MPYLPTGGTTASEEVVERRTVRSGTHTCTWLYGATAGLLVLGAGCGLDGGIQPLRSGIEGTITYLGIPPDSLVELRVVAFEQYDPATFKITDLTAWSDPIPLERSPIEYFFPLPPGRYRAILLAGRFDPGGWMPLEEYKDLDQSPAPLPVDLPRRTSVQRNVNFRHLFYGSESGISGRLIFANPWPDTVSSIRIGALYAQMTDPKDPPITVEDIEHLSRTYAKGDTDIVYSLTDTSITYRIELPPNTYRTVGIAWMTYYPNGTPESWTNITDIFKLRGGGRAVLGVYNQDGSLVPDSVVVEPNLWLTDIDIVIDFSRTKL